MGTHTFADFVASQQDSELDTHVDWDGIRDEWLADLDTLYARIIGYLGTYLQAGTITYSFTEIPITEENLGTYTARRMDISIGKQHVTLEPIGTLLIGCKGRVDAVGFAGRGQILLLNANVKGPADIFKVTVSIGNAPSPPPPPPPDPKSISWAWKIVTNTISRKFVDLEEESFFALLMEVLNA